MTGSMGNDGVGFLGCKDEESLMVLLDEVYSMMVDRNRPEEIRSQVRSRAPSDSFIDTIIDISHTRIRAKKKFPSLREPFFTSEGLRWATPKIAADHCARRLSRNHVMDLACGQGGQIISLAATCDRVTAVDIDPLNCLLARLNCISLGIDNVNVLNADSLSPEIKSMATHGCAIFCDPARPPGEMERTMEALHPDPREIIAMFGDRSSGFCFEVPPYLALERIDMNCEAEYVSIDGRLNRLNLYIGDLKRSERSAVILPSGEGVSGQPAPVKIPGDDEEPFGEMMFELDPSVVKAELLGTLLETGVLFGKIEQLDKRRTVIWSDRPLESSFIKDGYRILGRFDDLDGVRNYLEGSGIGSVTLRFELDPSRYWKVRNGLQAGLEGSKKAHLFKKRRYILAQKMEV